MTMLIGDDAIHGEEAYCFLDNVAGVIPSHAAEESARAKIGTLGHTHTHAQTDYKGQSILHGRDVEEGNNRSSGSNGEHPAKEDGQEIKLD